MQGDDWQNGPKVSVIIPAYNTACYIAETLDSVFSQTFTDYEVIVVNDGSPDTPELEAALRPYMDQIIYIVQTNKGPAAARNTEIHRARGEWLAFLDSDDLWLPKYLAEQMKFLAENPSLDVCIADRVVFGEPRPWPPWRCRGPVSFEAAVRGEFPQLPTTTVIRKATAVKAGLYDPRLRCGDDFEFFLRALHFGAQVDYP